MTEKLITISNHQADQYLESLSKHLDVSGKIGYAIARNFRVLRDNCTEYYDKRYSIIDKYGTKQPDSEEKEVKPDNPNYSIVKQEIDDLRKIKHEVTICFVEYDQILESFTARDILDLEWMLE